MRRTVGGQEGTQPVKAVRIRGVTPRSLGITDKVEGTETQRRPTLA